MGRQASGGAGEGQGGGDVEGQVGGLVRGKWGPDEARQVGKQGQMATCLVPLISSSLQTAKPSTCASYAQALLGNKRLGSVAGLPQGKQVSGFCTMLPYHAVHAVLCMLCCACCAVLYYACCVCSAALQADQHRQQQHQH